MKQKTMESGFSLVELSIVLVILGLLVGGVLSGQSLIRASELRSVSADLAKYQTALYSFRDKYFALPGDMTNATQFWGIAAGSTGYDYACWLDTTVGKRTCNGDGDGKLIGFTGNEPPRVYQHLANGGFVEGSYSGSLSAAGGYGCAISITCPRMKVGSQIGANLTYIDNSDMNTALQWPENYMNVFVVGLMAASAPGGAGNFLKPEEAWNIDTKMDDGKPGYGKVQTYTPAYPAAANCADSSTRETAQYKFSYADNACMLFVKSGT